jgi:hypothetical protein
MKKTLNQMYENQRTDEKKTWCRMKISFLLMSRGRPEQFRKSVLSLIRNVTNKENQEIICRLDWDDPKIEQYLKCADWNQKFIIADRGNGYFDFGKNIDECAKLATGDLLWQWADDALMMTQEYDRIVAEQLTKELTNISVVSSRVISDRSGGNYPFGFFAVTRNLYQSLGSFTFNQEFGYDRIWEAIAQFSQKEIKSNCDIKHEYHDDQTTQEGISCVEKRLEKEWAGKNNTWKAIASRSVEYLVAKGLV